jgi:hypothetical protein
MHLRDPRLHQLDQTRTRATGKLIIIEILKNGQTRIVEASGSKGFFAVLCP